jgi:hypothetical protein
MAPLRLLTLPVIGLAVACAAPVDTLDPALLGAHAPIAGEPMIQGIAFPRGEPRADGPTMSVVFTDGPLTVRAAPRADAPIVGTLDPFVLDHPTATALATSNREAWRLVFVDADPRDTPGWAPARHLTEYVPAHDFCESTDSWDLLTELEIAVEANSSDTLFGAISPTHGLEVRWLRNGAPHVFDAHGAAAAFVDGQSYDWGRDPSTDKPVELSLAEVTHALRDALADGEITCGALVTGSAPYEPALPRGHEALPFFSIHVPASDLGIDWVTFTVAVAYVEGVPYVAALSRYAWES